MYSKVAYFSFLCLALAGLPDGGAAQAIQNPANPMQGAQAAAQPQPAGVLPTYVLGPGDQMIIRAPDVDEINEKTFRIDQDGTLTLPLVGALKAGGRTVQQVEADITDHLKSLIRNPQVNITMIQYRQDIVFFTGAFLRPGLYNLDGRQTLAEMITKVGGLAPLASRNIRLTRKMEAGPIPLPGAIEDQEARVSTVDIGLGSLTDTLNPAEDIVLMANDVVIATKAEKIYVEGAFNKTGVLDLDDRESLSAMQVIVMSGGFAPEAKPAKAQILRPVLNTSRRAVIPIDLTQIMATNANDYPLLPNDVLFVPSGKGSLKTVGTVLKYVAPISIGLIFYFLSRN